MGGGSWSCRGCCLGNPRARPPASTPTSSWPRPPACARQRHPRARAGAGSADVRSPGRRRAGGHHRHGAGGPAYEEPGQAPAARRRRRHRPRGRGPCRGRAADRPSGRRGRQRVGLDVGSVPDRGAVAARRRRHPIIDCAGPELLLAVQEGMVLRIADDQIWCGDELLGKGVRQSLQTLEHAYEEAKHSLGEELGRFAVNTLEYLRDERSLVLDALDVPTLTCDMRKRQVLIVVRGHDYREDLAALRSYVREMRPVLIGVDGGADALIERGMRPDLIIGDFDSVSTEALACGAELVVHAYRGGDAPGAARLEELGLPYQMFEAPGTSEDIAMLLAYELGAELIVAVGTHVSMIDFLDKGRAGMASTFLVRLKVQHLLVDARGVSNLYKSRIHKTDLFFLLVAVMLCVLAMVMVSAPLRSV